MRPLAATNLNLPGLNPGHHDACHGCQAAQIMIMNNQDDRNVLGLTPLMVAIGHGDSKKAAKLLRSGQCDLMALDSTGNSVLMHAIVLKNPKCVEMLLDYSPPELFLSSNHFGKALGTAIRSDIPEIIELMLRKCPRDILTQPIIPSDQVFQQEGERQRQARARPKT